MTHFPQPLTLLIALALAACSSDDSGTNGSPELTGSTCTAATQCYPKVVASELRGAPVCLDKVENGYCTHACAQDSDCCAAAGECLTGHPQVCSPFESTDDLYCFLSCEDAEVTSSKLADSTAYCETFAGPGFTCRSSGGGTKNRKVCMF